MGNKDNKFKIITLEELNETIRKIEELQQMGYVTRSSTPTPLPIILIPKQKNEHRMCVSYETITKDRIQRQKRNKHRKFRNENLGNKIIINKYCKYQ